MMQNDTETALDELPSTIRIYCWFHQDSTPAHNSAVVRNYLNQKYGDKWVGNSSDIAWLESSPYLTSADYFFWGFI